MQLPSDWLTAGMGEAQGRALAPLATQKGQTPRKTCISRESSPGHIDGNNVFYHQTADADVVHDLCISVQRVILPSAQLGPSP
jgi:hypothetical protein